MKCKNCRYSYKKGFCKIPIKKRKLKDIAMIDNDCPGYRYSLFKGGKTILSKLQILCKRYNLSK